MNIRNQANKPRKSIWTWALWPSDSNCPITLIAPGIVYTEVFLLFVFFLSIHIFLVCSRKCEPYQVYTHIYIKYKRKSYKQLWKQISSLSARKDLCDQTFMTVLHFSLIGKRWSGALCCVRTGGGHHRILYKRCCINLMSGVRDVRYKSIPSPNIWE